MKTSVSVRAPLNDLLIISGTEVAFSKVKWERNIYMVLYTRWKYKNKRRGVKK